MRKTIVLMVLAFLSFGSPLVAIASPYDPESNPQGHVPTLMRDLYRDQGVMRAAIDADRNYVAGMRKHHQGAVTMSRAYLDAVGERPHPIMRSLANAIIANQEFEIALLNDVGRHVERAPRQVVFGLVARQMGWDGLEHTWRFVKSPPPGFLELWLDRTPTTKEDVRFAKGMIVHHQAAIDMANAYNGNPQADNRILKALNRDIVIDQSYEIDLLNRLIARFPGNPDAITVDMKAIHGMPDHGGH